MSKVVSEKQVNSFVKGLITEASALTFPENSSIDEDNFILELSGSRSRRLGVDYEVGHQYNSTGILPGTLNLSRYSITTWAFPGGSTDIVLGVIRAYNKLYFINLLEANPSAHLMNGGNAITITGLTTSRIQTAIVNNFFVLVSEELDLPVILTYDSSLDTITQEATAIVVRDFEGVDDYLTNDSRPVILSPLHKYNLINQGWSSKIPSTCATSVDITTTLSLPIGRKNVGYIAANTTNTAIDCTKSVLGVYPSNSDIWSLGKIGNPAAANYQTYDPATLKKNSIENTLAPKGAVLLNIYSRGASRTRHTGIVNTAVTPIPGRVQITLYRPALPMDAEMGRVSAVESFAGRIFYSGIVSQISDGDLVSPNYSGYVFFSQIAKSIEKLGMCYQENDPTSAEISDLLPTDGGTIHIPEANRIVKLMTNRESLIIFAENGIWELGGEGVNQGFNATAFQVSKVTTVGVSSPDSIVNAGGTIFYWAKTGIHYLTTDQNSGRLIAQNATLTTIQSYYNNISQVARTNARGFYNEARNVVQWLYSDDPNYSETNYINTYNKQLNMDLSLKAFSKFSFSSLDVTEQTLPRICDFIKIPGYSLQNVDLTLSANIDNILVGTDQAIITLSNSTPRVETFRYLVMKGGSFTIGALSNTGFKDWVTENGTGVDFSSYLVTGYEYAGDIMRDKQVPYIQFYFNRTENGFTAVGDTLQLDNPSGCIVQAQWNWTNSANSGKWGNPFQAYRLNRNYTPSGAGDTFDYGDAVIVTKNKLRGSGKVLSLKISSETGKDMQLLGWSQMITGKSEI
jgi:hypothetical protein